MKPCGTHYEFEWVFVSLQDDGEKRDHMIPRFIVLKVNPTILQQQMLEQNDQGSIVSLRNKRAGFDEIISKLSLTLKDSNCTQVKGMKF